MLCTIFTFQLCEMMEDENGKMDLRNTVYIEYERGISIDREFKLIYFLFICYYLSRNFICDLY
jgi:hypothetical protein